MTSTAARTVSPFVRGLGRAARGTPAITAVAAATVAGIVLFNAGILAPALVALALLTVPAIIVLGGLVLLGSGFLAIVEAAHEATVREPS